MKSDSDSQQLIVSDRIPEIEREKWFLEIDAIYCADPLKSQTANGEVLSKLLPIKNQGGFRFRGTTVEPRLIMIYTSGEDIYWRDEVDNSLGVLLYYGDNKTPGVDLHKTKLHGNEILRNIFALSCSEDPKIREKLPPVLVFKKSKGRDVQFVGLAVPGIKGKPQKDWLTAVWGCNKKGERFQNYKSFFTILDTSSGCDKYPGRSGINLAWITDALKGKAFNSPFAPVEWKKYIEGKNYCALMCKAERTIKSREEQLPSTKNGQKMLETLQQFFIKKDHGYSFESFANNLAQFMDNAIVDISTTRPYKDGGFDGIGKYKIFSNSDNEVLVDFYLQAKCYKSDDAVGVADTARLISRIKDRQFGIMFTTSYLAKQAFQELIEDGHPIVLINGRIIIDYLQKELSINDPESLQNWLTKKYENEDNR